MNGTSPEQNYAVPYGCLSNDMADAHPNTSPGEATNDGGNLDMTLPTSPRITHAPRLLIASVVYTSTLKRAIKTAWNILEDNDCM